MKTRLRERGQALILIALAFVGLAGFIGMAVDGGILFTDIGHLRRAVDAAALAAANQYRRNVPPSDLEHAAQELLQLNNLSAADAVVKICDWNGAYPSYMDVNLCPPGYPTPTERYRKRVSVQGSMPVRFAFLPIIGIDEITIHADAIAEAAALDLVLVIDESESMAYDAPSGDPMRNPKNCAPVNGCHPFEEVRTAALSFVSKMYFPFDRVSVVAFSDLPTTLTQLTGNQTTVTNAINGGPSTNPDIAPGKTMNPLPLPPFRSVVPAYCTYNIDGSIPGCMSTDIADGLLTARDELAARGDSDAVWVVVLLTDGAANQALADFSAGTAGGFSCPGSPGNHDWIDPYCRDGDFSHDNPGTYGYDAEDAARDAAYLVGCRATGDPSQAAACTARGSAGDGVGALTFTIGLGDKVINDPSDGNAGERLLRQIAAIGDDGDPASPDPCSSAGVGVSCGNYYYSPTGTGLGAVFDDIAKRIFTRLTQ
ncbi:MAG: vWA domain-containing protein [Anaerolineales bacterium]